MNPVSSKKRPLERRERKKSSWVWEYFEKDPHKRGSNKEGVKFVTCLVEKCQDPGIRVVKGNTTILSHHLRKEHDILHPETTQRDNINDISDENTLYKWDPMKKRLLSMPKKNDPGESTESFEDVEEGPPQLLRIIEEMAVLKSELGEMRGEFTALRDTQVKLVELFVQLSEK